jgi:hypothetical protein
LPGSGRSIALFRISSRLTDIEEIQEQTFRNAVNGTMLFIVHFAMDDVAIKVAEDLDRSIDSRRLLKSFSLMSHVTSPDERRAFSQTASTQAGVSLEERGHTKRGF